jgi:peptidyl-tRNA hydrolase, PTH1 family
MPASFRQLCRKVSVSLLGRSEASCERAQMKMIVGLGNPGGRYSGTRHNVGFAVLDSLTRRLGVEVKKKKFGALLGDGVLGDKKVVLLKPMRFMNNSGQVVATAAGFYRVNKEDVLIIADDMALEPGRIRIRSKGSAGGHNGLGDIIARLGSEDFARLRVGIGGSGADTGADYVLSRPAGAEKQLLNGAIERAAQAVVCWVEEGIDSAMNKYNVAGSG